MRIVHLTASTFHGGPERQMLELAAALAPDHLTSFLSFAEKGSCRAFLAHAHAEGFEGRALRYDTPRFAAVIAELRAELKQEQTDVLCCHGYKADLLGRIAARLAGVPVIGVSRGWTAETWKVRLYEALDRRVLRGMDRVVCVSEGQAVKVRRAGVSAERVVVIHNAIRTARFDAPDAEGRKILRGLFARAPSLIAVSAGRLSPEKGLTYLIEAARQVVRRHPDLGFVVFGDGALRDSLVRQIASAGLADRFVLADFRSDLDRLMPWADLFVLPSLTEGLPNVVLEAMAGGVPVVATAVGGTPEVVVDGVTGFLVPAAHADALAEPICRLAESAKEREAMGRAGRARVQQEFTFAAQAQAYERLFASVARPGCLQPV
jgi:glycosyltransferase involved in cell wall biosynthesis